MRTKQGELHARRARSLNDRHANGRVVRVTRGQVRADVEQDNPGLATRGRSKRRARQAMANDMRTKTTKSKRQLDDERDQHDRRCDRRVQRV